MTKSDVFGIGNALVDLLIETDDSIVAELGLNKGQFHAVDDKGMQEVLDKFKGRRMVIRSGGSAANATMTLAMMGAKVAFFGKVGGDEYGELFEAESVATGAKAILKKSSDMTGVCLVLVTPDAQRTFVVNLGVSVKCSIGELDTAELEKYRYIHLDGYKMEGGPLRDLLFEAVKVAKELGVKVSLDLSDPGVVARNREAFMQLVKSTDVLFSNEAEAKELTGKEAEDALFALAQHCPTVALKLGAEGSIVSHNGEVEMVKALPIQPVDTTGAGDAYASGILFGLCKNLTLRESANLANVMASKVCTVMGSRLRPEIVNLILKR